MAPRGRNHRKMVGNTRMDAALDAMREYGFEKQMIRETVKELLDVYDGTQGWPFIEAYSYRLLIDTILAKQESSAEEKKKEDTLQDNGRRDGVTEASSAATPTTGITEVGSSNPVAQDALLQTTEINEVGSSSMVVQDCLLQTTEINAVGSSSMVAQDTLLQTSDGLDSATQTIDQDPVSHGNHEADVKDSTAPTERGGHGQELMVKSTYELKPADNVTGSNYSHVENAFASTRMTESSQGPVNLPYRKRKPCYGWIDDEDDDNMELVYHPPSPEHTEKLIGQTEAPQTQSGSGRQRRRKSRWDEKPEGVL